MTEKQQTHNPRGPRLLQKFLEARDMLDSEIATAVGVDPTFIGHLRRGTRTPGLRIAFALERFTMKKGERVPADSWL